METSLSDTFVQDVLPNRHTHCTGSQGCIPSHPTIIRSPETRPSFSFLTPALLKDALFADLSLLLRAFLAKKSLVSLVHRTLGESLATWKKKVTTTLFQVPRVGYKCHLTQVVLSQVILGLIALLGIFG